MKVLFAPSEAKTLGGNYQEMKFCIDIDRENILKKYDELTKNPKEALKLFGTKELLEVDIFNSPTKKAIERYSGVAYEYLDYLSLDFLSKDFLDRHVIIFSNLFGPLCGDDLIPFYKLKQGMAVGNIKPENYYKPLLEKIEFDEEILDLRAGYYEKFYKPKFCVKMKFLKNGKVVSHWAKAYRGKILRELALKKIDSFKKLREVDFEGLKLIEIQSKKSFELWIFEVI